jgi:hypothetical protein
LIFSAAQIVQLCVVLLISAGLSPAGTGAGHRRNANRHRRRIGRPRAIHDVRLAVALYLSFSALQWMSSPGLYNLLMSRTPERERSTAAAMTLFCNALFQSGATALAGLLFTQFGYPRVLVGIAVFALLDALLFGTSGGAGKPRCDYAIVISGRTRPLHRYLEKTPSLHPSL